MFCDNGHERVYYIGNYCHLCGIKYGLFPKCSNGHEIVSPIAIYCMFCGERVIRDGQS